MKFFNNGIKCVKWFLRLLPILIIICYTSARFIQLNNVKLNTEYYFDSNNFNQDMEEYIGGLNNTLGSAYDIPYYGFYNISILYAQDVFYFSQLNNLIVQTVCDDSEMIAIDIDYSLLGYIIYILTYEIYLSFAFIVFNVFNYMLTICNKFLTKGEQLNE